MCRLAAALFAAALAATSAAAADLSVRGTSFMLTLDEGRVLESRDLVGARLTVDLGGTPTDILIEDVRPDPDAGPDVLLHRFRLADGGELCEPDPDGGRLGFPLDLGGGRWTLTCTSGAEGKCVRFGYFPWATRGVPLAPYHAACVKLMRADYCGDGSPTTHDGTRVNVFDHLGIQRRAPAPDLTFEAAFAAEGAVCIAHPRIPRSTDLDALARSCPRLATVPRGPACTEAVARDAGARVFVDSDPAGPGR